MLSFAATSVSLTETRVIMMEIANNPKITPH